MGHCDNLDNIILARLKAQGEMHLLFLNAHEVREELDRLAEATGREAFRILDGRLQALRKGGRISFDSKKGWRLTTKTPNVELTRLP